MSNHNLPHSKQKANAFSSVQEYRLQNARNIAIDIFFKGQNSNFKIFWRDWEKHGWGILFNILFENFPSKVLHLNSIPNDNEAILLKYSIRGLKRLCIGVYKDPSQNDKYFPDNLSKKIDELTCQYGQTIFIGGFNLTTDNKILETFINNFTVECLITKPSCFQSKNLSCIDLILTNKRELFINSEVIRSS